MTTDTTKVAIWIDAMTMGSLIVMAKVLTKVEFLAFIEVERTRLILQSFSKEDIESELSGMLEAFLKFQESAGKPPQK